MIFPVRVLAMSATSTGAILPISIWITLLTWPGGTG